MGLRGPTPKPTGIRALEGWRGHRPPAPDEPQFAKGEPDYPSGMTEAGKRIWDRRAPELIRKGLLCLINGPALGRLCENEARLEQVKDGQRRVAAAMEKEAKAELAKRLKDWNAESGNPKPVLADILPADGMTCLLMKPEGRRLETTIESLESLINVQQREFGLTPSASTRVAGNDSGAARFDPLDAAIA